MVPNRWGSTKRVRGEVFARDALEGCSGRRLKKAEKSRDAVPEAANQRNSFLFRLRYGGREASSPLENWPLGCNLVVSRLQWALSLSSFRSRSCFLHGAGILLAGKLGALPENYDGKKQWKGITAELQPVQTNPPWLMPAARSCQSLRVINDGDYTK